VCRGIDCKCEKDGDCDSGLCEVKILSPITYGINAEFFFLADRIRNVQLVLVLTANARRMVTAIRACAR
jgi:hypothetical protein